MKSGDYSHYQDLMDEGYDEKQADEIARHTAEIDPEKELDFE